MTIKKYLCPFIGSPADPPFRVPIEDDADYRASEGSSCMVLDLRTFEQYRDRAGHALITLDCPNALHTLLVARYGLIVVDASTQKLAIDAVIGPEAAMEPFDDADRYLRRVHSRRMERFRAERIRVR